MKAPDVVWTDLPDGFVHESFAAAGRTVLLGGGGQYVPAGAPRVPPAVLELHIGDAAVTVERFWKLPHAVPDALEGAPLHEAGPALVSAATIRGRGVSAVMLRASADFGGCRGGWFHPLGTDAWEFVGSASTESDIDANVHVGIGEDVLVTCEVESAEFFVVERARAEADVEWPAGVTTRSYWRPRHVAMPAGTATDREVHVSPDGRWIALRANQSERLRDGVLVYERRAGGVVKVEQLDYPGFRVAGVSLSDEWLAVLEQTGSAFRLRWREAVRGQDQYLELGDSDTTLHVAGSQALLTQGTRALVVDLARGVVTHNVQRGGVAQLGAGRLVPGFAVFALDTKVGVAPL